MSLERIDLEEFRRLQDEDGYPYLSVDFVDRTSDRQYPREGVTCWKNYDTREEFYVVFTKPLDDSEKEFIRQAVEHEDRILNELGDDV